MRSLRLQELQCISSLIDRFPLLLIRCFIRSSLLVASSSGSIDLVLSSCLSEMNKSRLVILSFINSSRGL